MDVMRLCIYDARSTEVTRSSPGAQLSVSQVHSPCEAMNQASLSDPLVEIVTLMAAIL